MADLLRTKLVPPRLRAALVPRAALVARLTLDSGDDDPVRFLRYLIAACQVLRPDLGVAALAQLDTAPQLRFDAVLTALINDLAGLDGRGILVLEDYHTIDAPQVHDLVAFLLDHLPAALHIMLLTRGDPPLPLARLRAQ